MSGTAALPRLTFADGSFLWYSSLDIAAPIFPDDHAWVSVHDETIDLCQFCGSRNRYALEIRRAQNGPLLFVELSGSVAQTPSADVLTQVFGAQLSAIPACETSFRSACNQVNRKRLDIHVATTPEQMLRHGEFARVKSSSDDLFDVLISRSDDLPTHIPNCTDGGPPYPDSTFIASRVSP